MADFILGGSKISADGDCNHEIKRRLLLGRKVMTNLDSKLKSLPSPPLLEVPLQIQAVEAEGAVEGVPPQGLGRDLPVPLHPYSVSL